MDALTAAPMSVWLFVAVAIVAVMLPVGLCLIDVWSRRRRAGTAVTLAWSVALLLVGPLAALTYLAAIVSCTPERTDGRCMTPGSA